jgi:hypothetical protein
VRVRRRRRRRRERRPRPLVVEPVVGRRRLVVVATLVVA